MSQDCQLINTPVKFVCHWNYHDNERLEDEKPELKGVDFDVC